MKCKCGKDMEMKNTSGGVLAYCESCKCSMTGENETTLKQMMDERMKHEQKSNTKPDGDKNSTEGSAIQPEGGQDVEGSDRGIGSTLPNDKGNDSTAGSNRIPGIPQGKTGTGSAPVTRRNLF